MKKLLSFLAITTLSITIGTNVTSCFLFPKKESVYDNVVAKIKAKSKELTWTNNEFINADGKVDLSAESDFKPGISELPEVWNSMLTDLFGLEANDSPLKNEFHYITDISSTDNILEKDKPEEVEITVAKYPTKPPAKANSTIIEKTITWNDGKAPSDKLVNETYNAIDSKTNIYALGTNLIDDSSAILTSDAIGNNIGLTAEQKSITTLSGTLVENDKSSIKFDIKDGSSEKTINKDVTWYKQTNSFLDKEIYSIVHFKNYAYFCTRYNGLWKMDLTDNSISQVEAFSQPIHYLIVFNNALYAATDIGLYTLNISDKLVKIDGYDDNCITLTIYNSNLYVATEDALYKLNSAHSKVELVDPGAESKTYFTYEFNGILYLARANGLYKLVSDKIELVTSIGFEIEYLQEYKNILYVGTANGLYKLGSDDKLKQIDDSVIGGVYSIAIYNDNLYLGIGHEGLYKLNNSTNKIDEILKISNETAIEVIKNTLFIHDSPIFSTFDNTEGIIFYYNNK